MLFRSFRYDYRINSRRETLTIGRYGPGGLSLARAREKCIDAKRAVSEGQSPAQQKQLEKRRLSEAKTFQEFTDGWYEGLRLILLTLVRKGELIHATWPEVLGEGPNEEECSSPMSMQQSRRQMPELLGAGGRSGRSAR